MRRTRTGGDLRDFVDVPLGEASELYAVVILNCGTVVRSFDIITTPTATYAATQQITDFGSTQTSISVKIYQISAAVGRGYGGVVVL